jgi:hypothetical protein
MQLVFETSPLPRTVGRSRTDDRVIFLSVFFQAIHRIADKLVSGLPCLPHATDEVMMLGPVSYLDCIVYCVFLAPQLIWRVGIISTALCVLKALPFLRKRSISPLLCPGVCVSYR